VPAGKTVISEFYVHVLESHWSGLRERGGNFERKAVSSLCNMFPLVILAWHCVKRFQLNRPVLDISHPRYSPDFVPTLFFSVPRQMNWSSEHLWQQEEGDHRIKYSSFRGLQWLVCVDSYKAV